jgi:hypothetical protein
MKRAYLMIAQWIITLGGLVFTAGVVRNLLDDSYDVTQRAKALACADEPPGCPMEGMTSQRSLLGQSFDFTIHRSRIIHVRCARDWVLVGDYTCALSARYEQLNAQLNAQPSAAPSPAASAPRRTGR